MGPPKSCLLFIFILPFIFLSCADSRNKVIGHPDILFHLSFDLGIDADIARGDANPLQAAGPVRVGPGGYRGRCAYIGHGSGLSYAAPGNIYAEKGTMSLWLKLDEPAGRVGFNILPVSYAQRSNWDFSFARIIWNGSSLAADLEDRNLERHSVEASGENLLVQNVWTHLALTWDERKGMHFYINGELAGEAAKQMHLAANLSQIGILVNELAPHMGIAGSEIKAFVDEVMIFGFALTPGQIAALAGGKIPVADEEPKGFSSGHWIERYGWTGVGDIPLLGEIGRLRLVGLSGAQDLGKFWMKGSDGKRETTWPPLMNHGYHDEGQRICFKVADEPFNLIRITGNFSGRVYALRGKKRELLLERQPGAGELSWLRIAGEPRHADSLALERESGVLGDIRLMFADKAVGDWKEVESYVLSGLGEHSAPDGFEEMVAGRFPRGQRATLVAVKGGKAESAGQKKVVPGYPIAHLAIPGRSEDFALGAVSLELGGIASRLPAGEEIIFNLVLRDPLYPQRSLIEADLRLGGGTGANSQIILDARNVLVPGGKPLWLTVAANNPDFSSNWLDGNSVSLNLVDMPQALAEHLPDRETQLKDSFQMLSEARRWMRLRGSEDTEEPSVVKKEEDGGQLLFEPARRRRNARSLRRQVTLIDELFLTLEDLQYFDPENEIAAAYRGWIFRRQQPPEYDQPRPPSADVPLWAFQQNLLVAKFRHIVDWWIDNRQIETGEFGGGLGDDTDLIQNWPAVALMGGSLDKIRRSQELVVEACYNSGKVVDGMNRRRTDALHAYEEGMNAVPLALLLDYGNPQVVERLMATSRHYARLTGVNPAGHRHFRSYRYSADDLVEEGIHARQDLYSVLLLHLGLYLGWFNGHPATVGLMAEYADGLLEHWQQETYPDLAVEIMFPTDEVLNNGRPESGLAHLFWGLYELTGQRKYLWLQEKALENGDWSFAEALNARWVDEMEEQLDTASLLAYARDNDIWNHNLQTDENGLLARQVAWEQTGEKKYLEDYQAALIKHLDQNMYLYTEAHQYTDRIWLLSRVIQRARLGGVCHRRNYIYPGHAISWENTGGQLAALVTDSGQDKLECLVYNLGKIARKTTMRVWRLAPGTYQLNVGPDRDGDDEMDRVTGTRIVNLLRGDALELDLPPEQLQVVSLSLIEPGTPVHERADLAISEQDLEYDKKQKAVAVTVHNLGLKPTGEFTVRLTDRRGKTVGEKKMGSIEAPLDFYPKVAKVIFDKLPGATGLNVILDPDDELEEITDLNNSAELAR
ncbi:LamG-like jellyroll fold domain-containing protein [Gemmatimonadota bacterium]